MTHYPAPRPTRSRSGMKVGLFYAFLYVLALWIVHIINVVMFAGNLTFYGIHPLDTSSLTGIVTSPFLHASFSHLMSNTVPGAIFAFLIGWSGHRVFWEVTVGVILVGGIGTWLIGGVGTTHVGASGLVYGWLAYLVVRGVFNRSLRQLLVGIILGVFYSSLIFGVLPGTPGVSWQAHLFGAIGGILAGMVITSDDPPKLMARHRAKLEK